MRQDADTDGNGRAVGDWVAAGDFLGAILAGLLLGWLADTVANTDPWFIVIGIIAGSAVGFWRMSEHAKAAEERALRHRTRRDVNLPPE